ncbi:unnamed protein product, partial [Urochloa humidicola]
HLLSPRRRAQLLAHLPRHHSPRFCSPPNNTARPARKETTGSITYDWWGDKLIRPRCQLPRLDVNSRRVRHEGGDRITGVESRPFSDPAERSPAPCSPFPIASWQQGRAMPRSSWQPARLAAVRARTTPPPSPVESWQQALPALSNVCLRVLPRSGVRPRRYIFFLLVAERSCLPTCLVITVHGFARRRTILRGPHEKKQPDLSPMTGGAIN